MTHSIVNIEICHDTLINILRIIYDVGAFNSDKKSYVRVICKASIGEDKVVLKIISSQLWDYWSRQLDERP